MLGIKGRAAPCSPIHFQQRTSPNTDAISEGRTGQTGDRHLHRMGTDPCQDQGHGQGLGNKMKEGGIFLENGRKKITFLFLILLLLPYHNQSLP